MKQCEIKWMAENNECVSWNFNLRAMMPLNLVLIDSYISLSRVWVYFWSKTDQANKASKHKIIKRQSIDIKSKCRCQEGKLSTFFKTNELLKAFSVPCTIWAAPSTTAWITTFLFSPLCTNQKWRVNKRQASEILETSHTKFNNEISRSPSCLEYFIINFIAQASFNNASIRIFSFFLIFLQSLNLMPLYVS